MKVLKMSFLTGVKLTSNPYIFEFAKSFAKVPGRKQSAAVLLEDYFFNASSLSWRASPLRFFAKMMPSPSIRKFAGIPRT